MSKTRQKSKSEIEHLKGQIKKLKAENRSLKKENRELAKRQNFYEELVEEVVEETDNDIDYSPCTECGKGTISTIDLYWLTIERCDVCGHEKRIKKK